MSYYVNNIVILLFVVIIEIDYYRVIEYYEFNF